MADQMTAATPRCQWCSAVLPAADLATCPSCGATLTSPTGTDDIKGVTTLDPEAILRARAEVARPRSRLLSFITGEQPVDSGGPEEAESLAPPDDAVRREMLRLQIEAERADLEAEAVALKTDAALDEGIPLSSTGDAADAGDRDAAAATAGDAPALAAPADAPAAASPQPDAAPPAPPPPPAPTA